MSQIDQAFQKMISQNKNLQRFRSEAYDELAEMPVPSRKLEEWKYTNPKSFLESAWDLSSANDEKIELKKIPLASLSNATKLVFVDGKFRKDLSSSDCDCTLFSEALPQEVSLLTSPLKRDFFERMNLALLNEGVEIQLSKTDISKPLLLIFHSTKNSSELAVNNRVVLKMPENSEATVVQLQSSSAETSSQLVSQFVLERNSSLKLINVQTESNASFLNNTQVKLKRDSKLQSAQITLGGSLIRNNLTVELSEEGAEAIVNGLYLGCGEEHIDNRTYIDHAVGNTTSVQLYKGVLDDNSHGVFVGGVKIRKDAQKSNSAQLNNNLMLSQKAEIDTKPELEIQADDVKAAHGATIGQLNADQIFYLQSRAITKQEAIEILSFGFALDIIERISEPNLRTELANLVKHKFSSFKVNT